MAHCDMPINQTPGPRYPEGAHMWERINESSTRPGANQQTNVTFMMSKYEWKGVDNLRQNINIYAAKVTKSSALNRHTLPVLCEWLSCQ